MHIKQLLYTGESGECEEFCWTFLENQILCIFRICITPLLPLHLPGWLCQLGESPGAPETFYGSWNMKMKSRQVSWIRFCHSFRINSSVDNCEADRADNSAGSNQISFLTSKWELCDFEQIHFFTIFEEGNTEAMFPIERNPNIKLSGNFWQQIVNFQGGQK